MLSSTSKARPKKQDLKLFQGVNSGDVYLKVADGRYICLTEENYLHIGDYASVDMLEPFYGEVTLKQE